MRTDGCHADSVHTRIGALSRLAPGPLSRHEAHVRTGRNRVRLQSAAGFT